MNPSPIGDIMLTLIAFRVIETLSLAMYLINN